MRAKYLLNLLPLGMKVRLVYDRFTVTPVATAFVFVALAHCVVQISLQAIAYSATIAASQTISQISRESNVSSVQAFVEEGVLKICDNSTDIGLCQSVTNTSAGVAYSADFKRATSDLSTASFSRRDLNLSDISIQCAEALNWPQMILHDARREDISFLVFQVWLLGISLVTILNESIPHLVTALLTHAMSSTWGVFQVYRTLKYGELYRSLVVNEACGGINVLSGYWAKRLNYFIPILALNAAAFIISAFVSYRLFKVYTNRTFKRVGYSDYMNLLYSYILTFSVALQLSAFFIICSSALWLDALFNNVLAKYTVNRTANSIIFINVCVWTLPWICIGWASVRGERRLWMNVFFLVGLFLTGTWISVFPTALYKEAFRRFPFFASMTVTSFALLIITLFFGTICRYNFGKGLNQYCECNAYQASPIAGPNDASLLTVTNQDLIDESSFAPVFLARQRRFTLLSVVFPDKPTQHATSHSQEDEKPASALLSDSLTAYSVQAPHVKPPGLSYSPESRRCRLLSLSRPRVDSVDLSAISEEGHSADRFTSAVLADEARQSGRPDSVADRHGSLANARTACTDLLDATSQSRASKMPPLLHSQPSSSSASDPLPCETDLNRKEATFAPFRNEYTRSPLSTSTPPLHFHSRRNPSFPRRPSPRTWKPSQ